MTAIGSSPAPIRQVQDACHTPTAALGQKASSRPSSRIRPSTVKPAITRCRIRSVLSTAGPSSSLATMLVSGLFFAVDHADQSYLVTVAGREGVTGDGLHDRDEVHLLPAHTARTCGQH